MKIEKGTYNDLEAILRLQKAAFISEAELYNDYKIQPLKQRFEEIEKEFKNMTFFKATIDEKIIGSVRGSLDKGICFIRKLIVHPDFQNKGVGKILMNMIENHFSEAKKYRIFTGHKSEKNIGLYTSMGYEIYNKGKINDNTQLVFMHKTNKK